MICRSGRIEISGRSAVLNCWASAVSRGFLGGDVDADLDHSGEEFFHLRRCEELALDDAAGVAAALLEIDDHRRLGVLLLGLGALVAGAVEEPGLGHFGRGRELLRDGRAAGGGQGIRRRVRLPARRRNAVSSLLNQAADAAQIEHGGGREAEHEEE